MVRLIAWVVAALIGIGLWVWLFLALGSDGSWVWLAVLLIAVLLAVAASGDE